MTEQVILLHGLARTARSMAPLAQALRDAGYAVANLDYPSRRYPVETLVEQHLAPRVRELAAGAQRLHFVTHSMGGILVRQLLAARPRPPLGRVVMLVPPSQGSEIVDRLGRWPVFGWINGPAGRQLGTGADGLPARLGPVDYPVGVIAASRSIDPLMWWLIPGANDGRVSVARARLEGMSDFIVVPHSHALVMRSPRVARQVLHFLREGRFAHGAAP